MQYTLFFSTHRIFTKLTICTYYKNKCQFQRTEIIWGRLCDHSGIKLDLNNKNRIRKSHNLEIKHYISE